MAKLNTILRGDDFEKKVYEFLKKELQEGKLLVNPSTSRIFQKKGYHSRDRGSDIITDLSVEVSYDGSSAIGLLMVIECKDYSHPVPVDDIEEFYAKVSQIAGLNVKAIFVTSAALQKSAFQYAMSKKIAVFRLLPEDQILHLIHYALPSPFMEMTKQLFGLRTFRGGLFDQDHHSEFFNFYGVANHRNLSIDLYFEKFFEKIASYSKP